MVSTEDPTSVNEMKNERLKMNNEDAVYNLSGMLLPKDSVSGGIVVQSGRKFVTGK